MTVAPKLRSLDQPPVIVSGFDIPQIIIPLTKEKIIIPNTVLQPVIQSEANMYIDDSAAPPPSFLNNFGDIGTTAATFLDLENEAGTPPSSLPGFEDLSTTPRKISYGSKRKK